MDSVSTNAGTIAERFRRRAAAVVGAIRGSVRRAALAVEKFATKRLSGSGAAWSYPVPVRTGFLRRSMFVQQPAPLFAIVGNSADYANAIHTGYVSEWAGRGKHRMRMKSSARPFLDDAVADADPAGMVRADVVAAVMAI